MLCLEDFQEPRRLPCKSTHVFCTRCLNQYIRLHSEGGEFPCPYKITPCNARHSVPEGGISGIRQEFLLATDFIEPDEEECKVKCAEKGHHDQEVIIYCRKHEKLVCLRCVSGAHSKCELVQLHEEVARQKTKIHKLMLDIEKYSEYFQKHVAETNAAMESCDWDIADMERKVEKSFRNIQSFFSTLKSKMMQGIKNIKKQKESLQIKSTQKKKRENINEIRSSCKDFDNEIDLSRMMEKALSLQRSWENLYQENVETFSWIYTCDESKKKVDNWLGNVTSQMKITDISAQSKVSAVMDIQVGFGGGIMGVEEVGDVVMAVQFKNNTVVVYGAHDGRRIKSLPVPGLVNPVGLVCTDSGRAGSNTLLVISDFGGQQLHFLTLSKQWDVATYSNKKLKYAPSRITLSQTGSSTELVVADHKNKNIYVYSLDGDDKRVVQLSAQHFTRPNCALKVDGGFIFSDRDGNQIVSVDENGVIKNKYCGSGQQKLQSPRHFVLDPVTGHVLVAVCDSHSVLELDHDLKYVRTVVEEKDGIRYPVSLHLSESGKLYLGSFKPGKSIFAIVKVFEYSEPSRPASQCHVKNTELSAKLHIYNWTT